MHVSGDEVWTRTPAKLVLCSDLVCLLASQSNSFVFMVYTDFFPAQKLSFDNFEKEHHQRVSNDFISYFVSVSPREQPQTIIYRNRHVFLWIGYQPTPIRFPLDFFGVQGIFRVQCFQAT